MLSQLGLDELQDLEESIKAELQDNLLHILSTLNRTGQLEEALRLWGLEHLINTDTGYHAYKSGKILVFGETKLKANVLQAIAEKLGVDKSRLELYLDYNDAKRYHFEHIKWSPKYSAILFGPCPHSGVSKSEYGSIISSLEHEQGYPPVIRMGLEELKITKNGFERTLSKLISDKTITV